MAGLAYAQFDLFGDPVLRLLGSLDYHCLAQVLILFRTAARILRSSPWD